MDEPWFSNLCPDCLFEKELHRSNPTPKIMREIQNALDGVAMYPGDGERWIDLFHATYWPSQKARVWVNLPEEIAEKLASNYRCDEPPTEGWIISVDQVEAKWMNLLIKACRIGRQEHPIISLSIKDRPTVSRVDLIKLSPHYAQMAEKQGYPLEPPFPFTGI